MSHSSHRPHALQWQVFRGGDAVRSGQLTGSQLRSPAWIHVRHDIYADARLVRDHMLACRATALRLPPGAVFAGPSAAYLHGIEHAAGFADEVHVIVPGGVRVPRQHGMRVHAIDLGEAEAEIGGRMPRTSPLRTAWDVAVWLELTRAIGIIDYMLARGLIMAGDLDDYVAANAGRASNRRAHHVFELADGSARSPSESHLRIRLMTAGLPRPAPRHPVTLPSGRVLRPSVAWPNFKIAIDLDDETVLDQTAVRTGIDPEALRRHHRLQLSTAGWTLLHVTMQRLRNDFVGFVTEARQALLSRGWQQ